MRFACCFCTGVRNFAYGNSTLEIRGVGRKSLVGQEFGKLCRGSGADYCSENLSFLHVCKKNEACKRVPV